MRSSLAEKLKCIGCGDGPLDVGAVSAEDDVEILTGSVTCSACGAAYAISSGVLDMVPQGNPVIDTELEGNVRKSTERADAYDDEWLLGLPESFEDEPERAGELYDHHNFFMMLDALGIGKDDYVLDLGCGTTWTSNELARFSRNVIASDISMEKFIGLESARTFIDRHNNYYERVRLDMCNMPFKDGSMDVTVNEASLHHAHDLDTSLKEVARVLKRGGRAVFVNEPMSSLLDRRPPSERHGFFERETYGWNENQYNFIEYTRALRRAGLNIDKLFFPVSVRYKLVAMAGKKGGRGRGGLKYLLGRALAGPYAASPLLQRFTQKVLFYPMLLFGIPFCAVAKKR